jgi:hypothetical protein
VNFDQLLESNIQLQLGCYFDAIELGPGKSQFIYSKHIADIGSNFGRGIRITEQPEIDWLLNVAKKNRRKPAILVSSKDEAIAWENQSQFSKAVAEWWMTIERQNIMRVGQMQTGLSMDVTDNPVPQDDFIFVFSRLFKNEETNLYFERVYVPVLKRAQRRPDVCQRHYVLHSYGEPVSCASIYWHSEIACLYNVGTRASQQKKATARFFYDVFWTMWQN